MIWGSWEILISKVCLKMPLISKMMSGINGTSGSTSTLPQMGTLRLLRIGVRGFLQSFLGLGGFGCTPQLLHRQQLEPRQAGLL